MYCTLYNFSLLFQRWTCSSSRDLEPLNFKLKFHLEVGLVEQRYFELFFRHGPYFHPTKDRCSTIPSSPFFTFVLILVIFAT